MVGVFQAVSDYWTWIDRLKERGTTSCSAGLDDNVGSLHEILDL
jgi:hypothetical protein